MNEWRTSYFSGVSPVRFDTHRSVAAAFADSSTNSADFARLDAEAKEFSALRNAVREIRL